MHADVKDFKGERVKIEFNKRHLFSLSLSQHSHSVMENILARDARSAKENPPYSHRSLSCQIRRQSVYRSKHLFCVWRGQLKERCPATLRVLVLVLVLVAAAVVAAAAAVNSI